MCEMTKKTCIKLSSMTITRSVARTRLLALAGALETFAREWSPTACIIFVVLCLLWLQLKCQTQFWMFTCGCGGRGGGEERGRITASGTCQAKGPLSEELPSLFVRHVRVHCVEIVIVLQTPLFGGNVHLQASDEQNLLHRVQC